MQAEVVESSPTVQLRRMLTSSKEKVVIVVLSAQPKRTGSTLVDDSAFLGAVVKALDEFRRRQKNSRSFSYGFPRFPVKLLSLVSSAARCGRSACGIAENFSPNPLSDSAWRTTTSALICPS